MVASIGPMEVKHARIADYTRTAVAKMASLGGLREFFFSFGSLWGIWCKIHLKKDRGENPPGLKVCGLRAQQKSKWIKCSLAGLSVDASVEVRPTVRCVGQCVDRCVDRRVGRCVGRHTIGRPSADLRRLSADCRSTVGGLFQICLKVLVSRHIPSQFSVKLRRLQWLKKFTGLHPLRLATYDPGQLYLGQSWEELCVVRQ